MPARISTHYRITRKIIYPFFIVLNIIVSLLRLNLFPDQPPLFHFSIFIITSTCILLVWELLQYFGSKLGELLSYFGTPYLHIIVQMLITYSLAYVVGETVFNNAARIFHVYVPPILHVVAQILYVLMSILLNLVYFSTNYFNRWMENQFRAERLDKEKAQMQYDSLRNQLNPHFLFNALSSLNSLIFEDQQLASEFLQQLSRIYRYVLQHKNKESVPLAVEADFIRHYISLLRIRFDGALEVSLQLREADLQKGIVPVTLQTLIENAIKHNIVDKEKPLHISIITDGSCLSVANNLQRKSIVETSNKHGLQNLRNLYGFLSQDPVHVSENEHIFEVKIPLLA